MECIFNHRNFWVNMRPELAIPEVGIDDFDIKEGCEKEWEYVMLPTVHKKVGEDGMMVARSCKSSRTPRAR